MAGDIMNSGGFRLEHDSMGELKVPQDALWGAQTQRAIDNFPISGRPLPRAFIRALALIKQAAAEANAGLGLLEASLAKAISAAAAEVAAGIVRPALSDRYLPDRLGNQQQHERQRGDCAPGGARGSWRASQ